MFATWIFFSLCAVAASAADCPACPTNGIWSEWTTTSECATTCGACSTLSYTRTCLSTAIGCPCVGSSTTTAVCNTQACNWPRTSATGVTCCVGTPMIYNNWYHCGPLSLNNTIACCPTGGYWATWSGWTKVTDQIAWSRSRTCLSGSFSCPCTGDSVETKYTCPCTAVSVITTASNPCSSTLSGMTPWSVRTPINMGSECKSMFVLEASNFRQQFYQTDSNGDFYTTVGYIDTTGACTEVSFTGTGTNGTNGQFYKFSMYCNIDTGAFNGTFNGIPMNNVVSIAQFYTPTA